MSGMRPVIDDSMKNIQGDHPFDLDDASLLVAASDYVFVGRIERRTGTRYPNPVRPQTDYDVVILEVVKGNLEAGQEILITKQGGISEDGSHVELFDEDDFMPEVGGVCVFLVEVLPDPERTLSVIGSYGTVPLETQNPVRL